MDDIVRKYSIFYDRRIKQVCAPLKDCFNISNLIYYKIQDDGSFVTLSSYPEQLDFYYHEKFYLNNPYLVHPSLMRSGSVLTAATKDASYLQTVDASKQKYEMDNTFLTIEKSKSQVEGFLYSTRGNHPEGISVYCDNYELLRKFGQYFRTELDPIIQKMHRDSYNLHQVKGTGFFKRDQNLPLAATSEARKRFLKAISPLSGQERLCLEYFRQGHSAQATAALMGLSRRTVEHYFENMKLKLNCTSKWDLLRLG